MPNNPIIVAIDTPDIQRAKALCAQLKEHVGAVKLGLEFFTAHGACGVREVVPEGMPLFLDLKFHDIPNTVGKAIRALDGLNIAMLTIHTLGGVSMMQSARDAADWLAAQGNLRPKVLGVTVLTSLNQEDLSKIGINEDISHWVRLLAIQAKQSGLNGIVCSPHEIKVLRAHFREHGEVDSNRMLLVTPGIRPAGSAAGDQKRTMTPREALDAGADYLVIGRPITDAEDPVDVAQKLLA